MEDQKRERNKYCANRRISTKTNYHNLIFNEIFPCSSNIKSARFLKQLHKLSLLKIEKNFCVHLLSKYSIGMFCFLTFNLKGLKFCYMWDFPPVEENGFALKLALRYLFLRSTNKAPIS